LRTRDVSLQWWTQLVRRASGNRSRERWLLDLAMEDIQVQMHGSILCDEFSLAAPEVDRCGKNNRMATGQGGLEKNLIEGGRVG